MLRRSLALGLLLSAAFVPAARAAQPDSGAALMAAIPWLHGIDAGSYAESWDAASSGFRGAITREKWVETLNGARRPLGDLTQRHVTEATFHTSLPGAPDGEYFVIRFDASFAHKATAVETVTMVKEKDAWKAAGYFIR